MFALDQRGHGRSAKGLADYGRAAFVADAIAAIEGLGRGPVLLVGQSLGGIHAMFAAAQRPELVRALVVIEAQAWNPVDRAAGPGPWLRRWPVPFASLAEARAFFVSQRLRGDVWIEFLEEHDDGYRPQFAVDEMIAALGELGGPFDYRATWERIACPVLVVGGAASTLDKAVLRAMADAVPHGRYAEIAGAYHDVHLGPARRIPRRRRSVPRDCAAVNVMYMTNTAPSMCCGMRSSSIKALHRSDRVSFAVPLMLRKCLHRWAREYKAKQQPIGVARGQVPYV